MAGPLTKLTQKNIKFEWNEACVKSFQELKDQLMFAPVLTLPSGSRGYIVSCNDSRNDLSCVLM